ncbi:unnamed protein product, partial [Effrenium voratum]
QEPELPQCSEPGPKVAQALEELAKLTVPLLPPAPAAPKPVSPLAAPPATRRPKPPLLAPAVAKPAKPSLSIQVPRPEMRRPSLRGESIDAMHSSGSSGCISFCAPEYQEAPDWCPGQSSDEELLARRAQGALQSPFFPSRGGQESETSSAASLGPSQVHSSPSNRSLMSRRGFLLELGPAARSPPPMEEDNGTASPADSLALDKCDKGVQLVFTQPSRRISRCRTTPELRTMPTYIPRPMPAAHPLRRNVFFFDWDDTLCPTSWIRSLLKEHMADMEQWLDEDAILPHEEDWRDAVPSWFKQPLPDEPHVRQLIFDLQQSCIRLLNVAKSLGLVCIVTNAVPGWVEKTIQRWLPNLRRHIGSHTERPIRVLYAQEAYIHQDLPFVDDQMEYMWWKKAAMASFLAEVDNIYSGSTGAVRPDGAKRLSNVVSIGDTEAEMRAAELVCQNFDSNRHMPKRGRAYCRVWEQGGDESDCGGRRHSVDVPRARHWPWVKLVKLREGCKACRMAEQMDETANLLPQLIALRRHTRVDLSGARTPMLCSEAELQLEHHLGVETI